MLILLDEEKGGETEAVLTAWQQGGLRAGSIWWYCLYPSQKRLLAPLPPGGHRGLAKAALVCLLVPGQSAAFLMAFCFEEHEGLFLFARPGQGLPEGGRRPHLSHVEADTPRARPGSLGKEG